MIGYILLFALGLFIIFLFYVNHKENKINERSLKVGSKWVHISKDIEDPWKDVPYFEIISIKQNYYGETWVRGTIGNEYGYYSMNNMSKSDLFTYYRCIYSPEDEQK